MGNLKTKKSKWLLNKDERILDAASNKDLKHYLEKSKITKNTTYVGTTPSKQ